MDGESLIKIIVAVVFFVIQIVVRLSKDSSESSSSPDSKTPSSTVPQFDLSQLEKLEKRATQLQGRIQQLPKHTHILGEALQTSLQEDKDRILAAKGSENDAEAHDIYRLATLRMQVLEELVATRKSPQMGAHLADAEALAESFLQPFRELSRSSSFAFARHHPICVPARPHHEAIWMGLLPHTYPLIFVPRDFGANLHRWGSLPHEIGHLIWHRAPGFAEEVRQLTDLDHQGRVPLQDPDGSIQFAPQEAFSAWLSEIVADAVATMMMGPAALQSFMACFANPQRPALVCQAHAENGYFSSHPPSHLRVLLSGILLRRMGFDIEAKQLLREWDDKHNHPSELLLPCWSTKGAFLLGVPVEYLLEFGNKLILDIYQHGYQSLDGREFRSIHGLVFSSGTNAQVQEIKPQLSAGTPVRAKPRLIVTAAILAAGERPHEVARIKEAVAQSIIGRNTNEPLPARSPKPPAHRRKAPSKLSAEDIRAAIVLHEVLPRQPFRSKRPLGYMPVQTTSRIKQQ